MTGKISLVLNAILLLAVIYLFTQLNSKADKKTPVTTIVSSDEDSIRTYPSIAWVHNDSLSANYQFIIDEAVVLKKLNEEISYVDNQLSDYEKRYAKLLQKLQTADASNTTQEAFDKDVKELAFIEQKVPDLQTRAQTKLNSLTKKQAEVNDTLAQRVDRFLKNYSSDKPIDLILLYTQGVTGLYATDQLDLTNEVLNGLNAEYKALKESSK